MINAAIKLVDKDFWIIYFKCIFSRFSPARHIPEIILNESFRSTKNGSPAKLVSKTVIGIFQEYLVHLKNKKSEGLV
jgi:hypothetical protein